MSDLGPDQDTNDHEPMMDQNAYLAQQVADLTQQLAQVTQERDEQCAGKMAFFNGMNDMREQRTALERQLATVTKERDEWHKDASSHLQALCEKQMELNMLEHRIEKVTQERDEQLAVMEKALVTLSKLGGGTSTGNDIARYALEEAKGKP